MTDHRTRPCRRPRVPQITGTEGARFDGASVDSTCYSAAFDAAANAPTMTTAATCAYTTVEPGSGSTTTSPTSPKPPPAPPMPPFSPTVGGGVTGGGIADGTTGVAAVAALGTEAIVGIAAAAVFGVLLIACICRYLYKKGKATTKTQGGQNA